MRSVCPSCDHGRVLVFRPDCASKGVCECGLCPEVDDCPECRIVACEACGTEGTIYSGTGWDGDYLYADRCTVCDGTGGEIVKVEPCTEEDLENKAAQWRGEA